MSVLFAPITGENVSLKKIGGKPNPSIDRKTLTGILENKCLEKGQEISLKDTFKTGVITEIFSSETGCVLKTEKGTWYHMTPANK